MIYAAIGLVALAAGYGLAVMIQKRKSLHADPAPRKTGLVPEDK